MRIAVIGSRSFTDYNKVEQVLKRYLSKVSVIVSGGASGADSLGERFATENNVETLIFYPDWSKGLNAGFLRNEDIINNCDIVIAFWDNKSKGTEHSLKLAKSKGVKCVVVEI